MANEMKPVPTHCGFPMWAVLNRRTSYYAISRERDTPIWYCAPCGEQHSRSAKIEISADGKLYREVNA